MLETINDFLKDNFYSNKNITALIPKIQKEILEDKLSSYMAAQKLLDAYYKCIEK